MSGDIPQAVIDGELIRDSGGDHFQPRFRIYHAFGQLNSEDEIIKFLKKDYGTGGGRSYHSADYWVDHSSKGLTFKKDGISGEVSYTLSWNKAAKRIRELIDADRYITPLEREQIYPQYLEYLEQQEILREKERFIESVASLSPAEKRDTLSLRLADYINGLARYEKEYFGKHGLPEIADAANAGEIDALLKNPQRVEQLIAALAAIKGATSGVFARVHAWRFGGELAVLFPRRHIYHLGDTVYIGSHEYEMLAFDENTVRLYDPQFPLINQEMPRAEFDRKIAENTMNDHLLAVVEQAASELKAERFLSADETDYYLFHFPETAETPAALSHETLPLITEKTERYVICAEACYLSDEEMARWKTEFRKMPRDFGLLPEAAQKKIASIRPEYKSQWQELSRAPELPTVTADTPRVLYKKYLPRLLDEIRRSDIFPFLRDRDTTAIEAENEITDWLDAEASADNYPGLSKAFSLPQFREWLVEDILDRAYQNVISDRRDGVAQHEIHPNCPDWARQPSFVDQVREELSLRGFAVSTELIATGIVESRAVRDSGRIPELADFIVREYLTEEPAPETERDDAPLIPVNAYRKAKRENPESIILVQIGDFFEACDNDAETVAKLIDLTVHLRNGQKICGFPANTLDARIKTLMDNGLTVSILHSEKDVLNPSRDNTPQAEPAPEPEPYTPKPGERYEIEGRLFTVDSVNAEWGEVSLRDITFQNGAGFPIFRKEPLDFIRMYTPVDIFRAVSKHEANPALEPGQEIREIGGTRYIVVLPEPERQPGYETWSEPATAEEPPYVPGTGEPSDDVEAYLPKPADVWYRVGDTVFFDNNQYEIIEISPSDGSVTLRGADGTPRVESPESFDALLYTNQRNVQLRRNRVPRPEEPMREQAEGGEVTQTRMDLTQATPRKRESGVNFPGEIVLVKEPIPRYTIRPLTRVAHITSDPQTYYNPQDTTAYGVWDSSGDGQYLKKDDGIYVAFDTYAEAQAYADQLNAAESEPTPAWEKERATQRRSRTNVFDPHPEIPMSERHNYRITDDGLGAGGAKTKFRNNIEAIKTLQIIESENRFATPEEQEILSRYVGWGALQEAFDKEKSAWTNEYQELKDLLSPDEYAGARASTVNAHYTSPTVIKAIYKAIENMGFKTGNVLEPSCGIGNFFGLVPESMADSKLFGVELDSLTGRIARQLYQKNSIAIQGFEKTELPDSFFDLAIGNVPFGSYGVNDKRYDKHKFHIHDYFFAKTLDKVRPGGVVAFVTSRFTLDKKDPAIRRYLAQRADLLGAIRLPETTFKSNAGTEVTTDIIFLQKRDRIIDVDPDWVHLGTVDGIGVDGQEAELPVNNYFAEHPDMILGTMSNEDGGRMYGTENSLTCVPFPDADLSEQLAEAATNIHAEITEYERDENEEDTTIPADPNVRNFSYTLVNGQIYYRQDSRMVPVDLPVTAQNRVKGLIELRECVRSLIMYQTDDYPDSDIIMEQAKLNRLYNSFTKKYGLINSRGNSIAFGQDSAYCLLCSLEIIDENGELERKADMFSKRTINPHIPITHVDTAVEALAVSMSEKARVDLAYMSQLTGMSEETLITELEGVIFLNVGMAASQDKTYVTADEYLSGNIREKLIQARAAAAAVPSLEINVKALEAAMPPDLNATEIAVRLGATWVPEDVIQRFMVELLQMSRNAQNHISVHYTHRTGEWNVTEKSADRSNIHTFNTYGTQRVNAYKIIEDSLNLRDVRVFDRVIDANGDEKRVLNKKETAIAQAKQEIIRSKFEEWIWKDPARRESLCRIYNDKFNSTRPRVYDGSHINFVGMNPEIHLRKHQIDAIAHILYGGNTLLAHEVGAGKTYEMVAAAMESKRLGLCHKSLIVVPNHITEQWAAEFLQLYPSANILVATKKDFETKNRKKFCARIATGDYDAVIIGHSQFEKIPMSAERQERMLEMQIEELADGIDEVKRNKGERYTIKQMERLKKGIELKLAKLHDQSRKDDVVTFEELGIDRLYIDESHYFKDLQCKGYFK
ncbi:MAG: DEAD/DEAH box helicase family protein [Oscillospiraceae bacterium]|nr:DEAD/DEAH box helicase family protein [Oscillospiraceae bacterium]